MADTKFRVADAASLLRRDHAQIRDLFEGYHQLGDPPRPSKRELFELIRRELRAHAAVEEEILYPAVEHGPDPRARELVRDARQEHRILRGLLSEIRSLSPDDESFDTRMAVLRETCEHHAAEEERELFPIFIRLPPQVREDVSDRLRTRRDELGEAAD